MVSLCGIVSLFGDVVCDTIHIFQNILCPMA